jgi:restriction endonuclease S subunit
VYYIDDKTNKLLWKSKVEKGTVLLCMSGSVGNCAVAEENWGYPVNSNQDIAKIILKDGINPYFVSAFFNSKYGKLQIMRLPIGSVQQHIFLWQLKTIRAPLVSMGFQEEVANVYKRALTQQKKAEERFVEAEQMLLKEINLEGYRGADEAISVRNFSEALADNRFDAEYWQPDYDVILGTLSKYKKGVSTIGKEFKQLKGNFKAEKDKEYNYVEIGDVNVSTGEVDSNVIIGAELPANAKIKFCKRQLITSKVRPNRGATAILDNHEGFIGSGAFTVLTEQENINLETLMVYLKAKPIRELLLRYNTGTSYPVITDSDVLKLPIPLIDKSVQKKISELVSVSAKERQEAKVLLEKAKRAVEIFVEKDEKEAMDFLVTPLVQ